MHKVSSIFLFFHFHFHSHSHLLHVLLFLFQNVLIVIHCLDQLVFPVTDHSFKFQQIFILLQLFLCFFLRVYGASSLCPLIFLLLIQVIKGRLAYVLAQLCQVAVGWTFLGRQDLLLDDLVSKFIFFCTKPSTQVFYICHESLLLVLPFSLFFNEQVFPKTQFLRLFFASFFMINNLVGHILTDFVGFLQVVEQDMKKGENKVLCGRGLQGLYILILQLELPQNSSHFYFEMVTDFLIFYFFLTSHSIRFGHLSDVLACPIIESFPILFSSFLGGCAFRNVLYICMFSHVASHANNAQMTGFGFA